MPEIVMPEIVMAGRVPATHALAVVQPPQRPQWPGHARP